MCGIFGWFDNRQQERGRPLLEELSALLKHRGPDDEGTVQMGPVHLAHRRLSIIDISGGHQPMLDDNERRVIVFNGEIYNFLELRSNLQSSGHEFKTKSDTEVLLHMYDEYGIECLDYLNGMFAFALWDGIKSKLILVRDRLGIKPLYYSFTETGCLVFASEIKSILGFPGVERTYNLHAISSYLSFRRCMGQETLFKNIFSLEPGCYLEIDTGKHFIKRYWRLPTDKYEVVTEELSLERTEELLRKSVERRLISDVPLGAFLSGGLDSSAIVALMSSMMNSPVKTYSIGFKDEKYNELSYCEMVAKTFGTDHRELILDENDYLDLIPKLIRIKDEPLAVANEVALYQLARYLKKDITVVLSGEGADELFAGYGRIFRSPYDYMRLKAQSRKGKVNGDSFGNQIMSQYGKSVFHDELDHFMSVYKWMSAEDKQNVLSQQAWDAVGGDLHLKEQLGEIFDSVSDLSHYDKYLYFFQRYHLENLLRRVDMTTMASAVEARVPFVDHELVEHVSRLPFESKLPWKSTKHWRNSEGLASTKISERFDEPKYILKKLMRDKLPRRVIARRKMGFPVPLEKFFKNTFFGYAKDILCDSRTRGRNIFNCGYLETWMDSRKDAIPHAEALQIWMLVNVELWLRIYFDEVAYESNNSGCGEGREVISAY